MTNPNKVKGSDFERLTVETLKALVKDSDWKRVPGSGAIGTSLSEPLLTSDVIGRVSSIPKSFKIECKVGYNFSKDKEVKQFTIKKEWFDKVRMEADATHSIPLVASKFSGARNGTKIFISMDVEIFAQLLNHITKLQEELNAASDNTRSTSTIS